jgi:hypothetical protein
VNQSNHIKRNVRQTMAGSASPATNVDKLIVKMADSDEGPRFTQVKETGKNEKNGEVMKYANDTLLKMTNLFSSLLCGPLRRESSTSKLSLSSCWLIELTTQPRRSGSKLPSLCKI